ncbi:MAG TPA: hypothetical protein VGC05_10805, partial [Mycobacterium sp.]
MAALSLGTAGILALTAGNAFAATTAPVGLGYNATAGVGGSAAHVGTPTQLSATGVADATGASTAGDADETVASNGYNSSLILTPGGAYVTGAGSKFAIISAGTLASPQLISGTAGTTQVAAGLGADYLLDGGSVYAFGANTDDAAGNSGGTSDPVDYYPTPTAISFSGSNFPAGTTITQVAAGGYSGLAIDSNGNIWSWGIARTLGSSTAEAAGNTGTPQDVSLNLPADDYVSGQPVKAVAIAAGFDDDYALLANGNVIAWGANKNGEIGNGSQGAEDGSGAAVYDPVDVIEDATSSSQTTQTTETTGSGTVTILPYGVTVKQITAGGDPDLGDGGAYAIALLSNGSFDSWGSNEAGELGLGTGVAPDFATVAADDVLTPEQPNPNGLSGFPTYPQFTEIQAEESAVYGLTASGAVYGWGGDNDDELGGVDGDASTAATYPFPFAAGSGAKNQGATEIPTQIPDLSGVTWLTTGGFGDAQIVQSVPPLTVFEGGHGADFLSVPVGTISKTQSVEFIATTGASATITGITIGDGVNYTGSGAVGDLDDFLVVPIEDTSLLSFPITLSGDQVYGVDIRFAPSQ